MTTQFYQYNTAAALINEIKADISRLSDLDPLFILDLMGILGIQFAEGTDASKEYFEYIKQNLVDHSK